MKKLILPLLLMLSVNCFAQNGNVGVKDSLTLRDELLKESKRLDGIQSNLLNFSRLYSTGTVMLIAGSSVTLLGVGMAISEQNNASTSSSSNFNNSTSTNQTSTAVLIGGATLTLAGGIVHIVAHKFIRKAGSVH